MCMVIFNALCNMDKIAVRHQLNVLCIYCLFIKLDGLMTRGTVIMMKKIIK